MFGRLNNQHLGQYNLTNVNNPEVVPSMEDQDFLMNQDQADRFWQFLKYSIQQIQRKRHTHLKFEELYRHGYYLTLNNYGTLHRKLEEIIHEYIVSEVQTQVLANLNENFLVVINDAWDHHHTSMMMISDVLMYMDRVLHQFGLDNIYTLGLKIFRDQVVCNETIQIFFKNRLLGLVITERHGELVDRPTFRRTNKLLMVLGNNSRRIYEEVFEAPFLQQSQDFYQAESEHILTNNSASFYLRYVQNRLHEEVDRAQHCFDGTTSPQIVKVVEERLIRDHMITFVEMSSGVVHMMQNQMVEELSCMYMLLSRVPGGLATLFNCVSNFLRNQGQAIVGYEDTNINAIVYIQNLLNLKEKIDFYVINSFFSNNQCKQIIASDFEQILNLNKRSSEYLSLFIDEKLKKTARGMSDDDKVVLLDKTMVLFRFIDDKDVFAQYYQQDLAKRLIFSKTVNEENEKRVISKFKAECGNHYTYRLEGMFHDIQLSSNLTEAFHKFVAENGVMTLGVTFNMKVLKSINWPTQNNPSPCNLPLAPFTAYEAFRTFYLNRHSGRKLTLLSQLGSAELEFTFLQEDSTYKVKRMKREKRCYTLQVSTYQMCILMKYNERTEWKFEDLLEKTNISSSYLEKALQSLVTQMVLIKRPNSPVIENGDIFHLNTSFSSKTNRVKIPPFLLKHEVGSDKQDTLKKLNEGRNYEIDAAIIRVLKAQRKIKHEHLINEVTNKLSPRFTPTIEEIKIRIENLIEREFIARIPGDRKEYGYIA